VQASFVAPITAEQLRYDELGTSLMTGTYSTYQQQRLVRVATRTSNGWTIQRYKRLSDYTATTAVAALRKYHYNPVVETQIWTRPAQGADSTLIGGRLTLYDPTWRSPQSSWSLRLPQPASGPNAERQLAGKYTAFQSDTRYRLDESVSYDPVSGLLQQRQIPRGLTTAYIWGYDHAQIVAQVDNATYSQVLATLTQPVLDRLASANPGTDAEVRQFLAPLRTYTYLPLVGLTSQTDPAGRSSYYEYDALGRLLRVRDDQGRLLTQQEYHYARP
jgi:YD repeat-containing protein